MSVEAAVPVGAKAHPNQWTPVEQKFWGGPEDTAHPYPEELLHISVYHSGPGVDELVRFYQVVLNLRFTFRVNYGDWEFIALSHDDENHRIGIVNAFERRPQSMFDEPRPEMAVPAAIQARQMPQRPCRIEHMNWRYRDMESILLVAKRAHEELGIWPFTTRLSPADFTIDYLDPDGNRVELVAPFASTRGEILWNMSHSIPGVMAGPADYDAFYLGLDMEKLLGLYESGVPLSDLASRPFMEERKAEGKV